MSNLYAAKQKIIFEQAAEIKKLKAELTSAKTKIESLLEGISNIEPRSSMRHLLDND